ncbi:uncharacterized protein LOC118598462 [Oryzias melastigma]|uniref:uncharacterized protein LOC118598462 n=1 Tax=Oryzias melastigma TaxID=30732 RepID=UPI00168CBB97|nr:uncharacterized protein LOC118598462 [Oryzias melastigma]
MGRLDLMGLRASIEPLENGLRSLSLLSEMLLHVDADAVFPGGPIFDGFRRAIQEMEKHFKESEHIATVELHRLDEETERLTADQSDLEKKKKEQDAKLGDLKMCLDSYESSLKSYSEARETEQRNLNSAEETLKKLEGNKNYAQTIRDVGIGLLAIPFFGWISGGIMVGVGQTDLNTAHKARQEVEKCDSQVKVYSQNVSDCKESIAKTQAEIKEVSSRISEMEAELKAVTVERETVADIQSQTRKAVHHLGLLSGVGNAAELQSRNHILMETTMKVMNELTPVLTQITGSALLPSEGLKSIMEDMNTNQRKLKANLSDGDENYY